MIVCQLSDPSVSEEIAKIEALCNRPPWPAELFASEFTHNYAKIYGARTEGKLIGFLALHRVLDEIHILNFGIHPDYRGHGYGKKLLQSVIEDSVENAQRWATLEVRVSNTIAISLYKSLGFFEVGVRKAYYTDDQEDGLVLKCDLKKCISS